MTHLITTTDTRRRQLWQRLFDRDALPVLHPHPRWQWLPGHSTEALAYDLDVQALPDGALARLAAYVAQRSGWPYNYAQAAVQGGWAILATHCHLVASPEAAATLAESSAQGKDKPVRATPRPTFRRRKSTQLPPLARRQTSVYASS